MHYQRNLLILCIGCSLAALLYHGLRPQPVLVEASVVTRASFKVSIEDEGVTRLKDRYRVSAPVSGYLRRIELKVGDQIRQGDLLTELEPLRSQVLDPRSQAEAEARVAAARAGLQAAEQQVEAVRADDKHYHSEYQRKLELSRNQLISADELSLAEAATERAKATLRSARFAVDVARYELDAASTRLKYSAATNSDFRPGERVPITAPVTGAVINVIHESEGVVSAGEALLEVGDPAALEVAVDVLSFDAVRIKPGMAVELNRWGGEPLHGYVRLVEPVGFTDVSALGVEEQRVWVIVDISSSIEEWQRLGDGYRVEARFILWQGEDVLQAPNSSLFRVDDHWAVFVAVEGRARLQQVTPGQRSSLYSQILHGLEEGQVVIEHPDDDLADGVRITIR